MFVNLVNIVELYGIKFVANFEGCPKNERNDS